MFLPEYFFLPNSKKTLNIPKSNFKTPSHTKFKKNAAKARIQY